MNVFWHFLSVELHVANFGRVNTDRVHKFGSPGPILFLLDCTIPIKPTRNVKNFVCFLCPNSKRIVASLRLKNEIGERQDSLRRLGWACASMLIASIQTGRIHLACFTVWVRSPTLPPLSVACIWKPRLSNLYRKGNVFKNCVKKMRLDCTIPIKPTRNVKKFVCFLCPNSKRTYFILSTLWIRIIK